MAEPGFGTDNLAPVLLLLTSLLRKKLLFIYIHPNSFQKEFVQFIIKNIYTINKIGNKKKKTRNINMRNKYRCLKHATNPTLKHLSFSIMALNDVLTLDS